jgi:NitT/TauT family transport system substrate-binding protein
VRLTRAAFVAGSAAFATAARPQRAAAQTAKIRLGGTFSDAFGEQLYAKEAGAFARAGFDVEATSMNNAGAVVAALGAGALDMGIGDLISGVNAINAGVPNVLVAGAALYLSREGGTTVLAVAKDSPIRKPSDLTGKSIGVPTLVGMTTASLKAWLPTVGVDVTTVKIVEISQPASAAALVRGTIDCGLLSEPFITPNRDSLREIGRPLDAVGKEFCQSVWYASKPWLEADRGRARRAVAAIYDTARWANSHHAETFAILVRDAHFDAEKIAGMTRCVYATTLTPALVQPVLNVAAQYKIFDHLIDANTLIAKL